MIYYNILWYNILYYTILYHTILSPPVWSAGARSLPGLAGWSVWLGDRPKNRRRCVAFSFVCGVLLCTVVVHEVTQLPEAGVPELESQRASSHIWLMRAAAFCEQLALHFWPLQGVQLARARSGGARASLRLALVLPWSRRFGVGASLSPNFSS